MDFQEARERRAPWNESLARAVPHLRVVRDARS